MYSYCNNFNIKFRQIPAIFRAMSLLQEYNCNKMYQNHSKILKTISFWRNINSQAKILLAFIYQARFLKR